MDKPGHNNHVSMERFIRVTLQLHIEPLSCFSQEYALVALAAAAFTLRKIADDGPNFIPQIIK